MTPVDVGPELNWFWFLIIGLPLLILVGMLIWHQGWLGTLTEGRLDRLLDKAKKWEDQLRAKDPPVLKITPSQEARIAALEQAHALGQITDDIYKQQRALILATP